MQAELRAIVLSLSGLAEVEEPLRPDERVRSALLASLYSTSSVAGFVDRLATFFDLSAEPAQELLYSIAHVSQDPGQASARAHDKARQSAQSICDMLANECQTIKDIMRELGLLDNLKNGARMRRRRAA